MNFEIDNNRNICVGIVTITTLDNYGNRLQNHATKYILNHLLCDSRNITELSRFNLKVLLKGFLYPILNGKKKLEAKRILSFLRFTKNHIGQCYLNKKAVIKYNYIICGSDQVWNPAIFKPFYFAAFAPPEKRIAYAASFGVSEIPEHKKEIYTRYLNEMKAISVREEAGAKIVKELTGRDVPVLVDPTLMLDKEDWQKVSKKPKYKIDDKYILTYFLGEVSDKRNNYIENIAKKNGLQIIRLEGHLPNKYWYGTGPAEFIWLIEHCSLMCTDSFHGSVFSVLMDVPFIVFEREDELKSMSSRIDTLLSTLKLEDRRFDNQNGEEIFKKEYAHIPEILKTEGDKAIHFLKNAMELE